MMTTNVRILRRLGNGPTRRNLFGPVDREQLRVEYQAALQKDLEEASRRWGFDFLSDEPLEGSDFQWECVPGTKVPLLYRSSKQGLDQRGCQTFGEAMVSTSGGSMESPPCDKENITHTPERCLLNLKTLEITPERRENTGLKRKQTHIKDFYQAKRRVVGTPRKSGE
ncbi:cyclin-dependent kinase inhibitor 1 isoform X2 [Solea solea]|nr:cyclin-dependent kinase inhibitor 1 isoform X2 [Solea solea]